MSDDLIKSDLDESGIVVEFHRYEGGAGGTAVVFKIPDHCTILSRDPHEFMRWCYVQMMQIATQAKNTTSRTPASDTCKLCGHSLVGNQHGLDQNDAYLDGEKFVHSGRCTYCLICRGSRLEPR